jgi:hypothetical protein
MSTHTDVERREDIRVSQQAGLEKRQVVTEDVGAGKLQTLERISALIIFAFGALEGFIGLRILLKLIDANSRNAFTSFVYSLTGLFLWPFAGLTGNPATSGGNVLEFTSIIAMIVYTFVGWGVIRLFWLIFYQPSTRTVSTYERDQSSSAAPKS